MTYPDSGLIRMATELRLDGDNEGGMRTLTGTPIVFNEWTVIRGWEGHFRERIKPKALKVTLAERGDRVKVLFNHGMDPAIGSKPLGKPSRMDTDKHGLHVEVPLSDTTYNRDLQTLIADGALDGMSFRFDVISDEWDLLEEDVPERTITELRLHEFGPVTFPAYEATTVGVRSVSEYVDYMQRRNYITHQDEPAPAGSTSDRSDLIRRNIAAKLRTMNLATKGTR